MNEIEQLKKRVEELESEVARLKAIQVHVIHSHYHYAQPMYLPQPTWVPGYPSITYGSGIGTGITGQSQ